MHGEHYVEILDLIKQDEAYVSESEVIRIEEKGKGTIVTIKVTTRNANGNIVCVNEGTTFNRGARPKTNINKDSRMVNFESAWISPAPNHVVKEVTSLNQAAIYRLSGDFNPLHM